MADRPSRIRLHQEQRAQREASAQYAKFLFDTIRQLLYSLERYRHVKPPTPEDSGCSTGAHPHSTKLEPQTGNPTHVVCVATYERIPDYVLQSRVIKLLRDQGFEVSDPQSQSCGCVTFTATPRSL